MRPRRPSAKPTAVHVCTLWNKGATRAAGVSARDVAEMVDEYPPYPPRPRNRLLIFIPLKKDYDVPIIFDTAVDVNVNCGRCGQTLISHVIGEHMKVKKGVLDEEERNIVCPHCSTAAEMKQKKKKSTKSPKSRRTSRARPTTSKDSDDS
jgi:DNA-directed RNA polymerase subunit RPC12/RpoP